MITNSYRLILALAVLLVIFIIFSGLFLKNPFEKPESRVDLSRSSVIKDIQELGRLETASYSIEKIIEAGVDGNALQDILYGDRILLIAHGKVIAGVDLSKVKEEDVTVLEKTLTLRLPAPEIFASSLDNEKTTVYDRRQGLLSRGDKDLESEARLAAEQSINQAACEADILTDARNNAIERLTQLFEFAGFATVTISIPQGSC